MKEDATELDRLDVVAGNYSEIGGLRLVPIGMYSVEMAVLTCLFGFSSYWSQVIGVWSLESAIMAHWAVALWYLNRYGWTPGTWPSNRREEYVWAAVWTGILAMVSVAIADVGPVVELLGDLAGAAAVVWMLVYWRRTGRMWPQSCALSGMVAIGGLLHQTSYGPLQDYAAWWLGLAGATFVILGIVDHIRLAKTAPPLEEEDESGE